MTEILISLLAIILIIAAIVFLAVRRGLQFKELSDHGVDVQAVVEDKRALTDTGATSRQKKIAYRYADSNGQTHHHTSVVPNEIYHSCEVGGPFPVIYSTQRPEISAPKYLVNHARKAVNRG